MISVIIPVYNRIEELRRALQSLVEQTVKGFEVLVCDDGSEEDVRSVVHSFEPLLKLKYFHLENSGGPAIPRNCGISQSSCEWISFLDSDDWWAPNRIKLVSDHLTDQVDLVYHKLKIAPQFWYKPARVRCIGRAIKGNPLADMLSRGNPIPNSSMTVRRTIMKEVGYTCTSPALKSFEDFDTWIKIAERGARFLFINRSLGYYWIGEDNISKINQRQLDRHSYLFSQRCKDLPLDLVRWANSYEMYQTGTYLLYLGRPKESLTAFKSARHLRFRAQRFKRIAKMGIAVMQIKFANLRWG